MTKLVHVAVGVIVNADGDILIAKRAANAHQGGLWEFPGGKVDAGETVQQALVRELYEELAIDVLASQPLIQIRHHYPDKSVLLDVHTITQFTGTAIGNEGQPVCWVTPKMLYEFEFPAANHPIITAVNLPKIYAISGNFVGLSDLSIYLQSLSVAGIKILQLRMADFCLNTHESFLVEAMSFAEQNSVLLLVNCSVVEFKRIQAKFPQAKVGLHLNHHHAALINSRPVAAEILFGVSCHNEEEIYSAQSKGADYLFVSPVLPTESHPDSVPLGWPRFAELAALATIPVYALGGVGNAQVELACESGAQGVAGISAWW